MFKGKPRFELLDQYLARREYGLALEAISDEIKRRPENFNLLLRQAELLGQAGDKEQAIEVYRRLARHYTDQGFFARAIAVTNKIVRLDPERGEVTRELADLIAAQQESERAAHERMQRASFSAAPAPAKNEAALPAPQPLSPPPPVEEEPFEIPPPPPQPTEQEVAPLVAAAVGPAPQLEKERQASQFFAAFPRAALEDLLSSTSVRNYAPEEVIVREGEPGTSLFLIVNGTVEVHTQDPAGQTVVLAMLGPGEFFGEVAVLTGRPRTATIIAREQVTLIEISREDLERIAAAHPEVRRVLERFYTQRAHATVEAMLSRLRGKHG